MGFTTNVWDNLNLYCPFNDISRLEFTGGEGTSVSNNEFFGASYISFDLDEAYASKTFTRGSFQDSSWAEFNCKITLKREGENPINAVVSDYGEWGQCSKDCGTGTQTRRKTCTPPSNGGTPCPSASSLVQTRDCNTQVCALNTCNGGPYNSAYEHYIKVSNLRCDFDKYCDGTLTSALDPVSCDARLGINIYPGGKSFTDSIINNQEPSWNDCFSAGTDKDYFTLKVYDKEVAGFQTMGTANMGKGQGLGTYLGQSQDFYFNLPDGYGTCHMTALYDVNPNYVQQQGKLDFDSLAEASTHCDSVQGTFSSDLESSSSAYSCVPSPIVCSGSLSISNDITTCNGQRLGLYGNCLKSTDSVVSAWGEWGQYSNTCNSGTQTRSEQCTPASGGGEPCPGSSDLTETRNCNTQSCSTNSGSTTCNLATYDSATQAKSACCATGTCTFLSSNQNGNCQYSCNGQCGKCSSYVDTDPKENDSANGNSRFPDNFAISSANFSLLSILAAIVLSTFV